MKKRVFIVHGWGGDPEEGWFPWFKKELEGRGFEVIIPSMPNSDNPVIEEWVEHFGKTVGEPDQKTYLVGHSIGCQTIMRYLEKLPEASRVGGVVFIAGWFTLSNLEPEEEPIAKPWLETPINCEKIKQHLDKFVAIFSDDDPYVSAANQTLFAEKLGAKVIMEHGKGHFSGDDNISELPSALEAVLAFTKD